MGIEIKSGAGPLARARKVAVKYSEVDEAVKKLQPNQWFIVPGTKGKSAGSIGIQGAAIVRRAKKNGYGTALIWYGAADGSGLVIRRAPELDADDLKPHTHTHTTKDGPPSLSLEERGRTPARVKATPIRS